MEQLIAELEAKTILLSQQLKAAQNEIAQLKQEANQQTTNSASMDLLSNMNSHSTEDQLQLYISDSLDLLSNTKKSTTTNKTKPAEQQLNFDLFHEQTEISNTPTPTDQINKMTSKQNEQINEPVEEKAATDTNSVTTTESNDSDNTKKLTPEQKARQKNQKNNRRLIKMLEDRYPKAFDWNKPKPLKVGIDKDMTLDDEFNASKQKRALAAYTRSDRYKKCLLSGQPRIDLEGVAVSDEPALPESMMPAKKARPAHRPTQKTADQQRTEKAKKKPLNKNKQQSKNKKPPTQDDAYANLSAEERMKAKLEKLFNKS
ncbi:ProQ/FINO family protein [Marinomonas sp. C2222]|uniref:ProQ/FINO family protein n=1 Tax=Marinomonas sargassi TaxID=2984494 RepID=A0ABT2YUC6_9GAMM|nr:ProQ/FINO family protein [Marinomonas sargassi]MCV2403480.1 ProQ/FINO family protein [Marinomonas sargassi]